MKRIQAEYPYNDYYLYIVHHKKENRNYVVLIPIDKSNKTIYRTTMSYARYIMSVYLKRKLHKEEQVDHIDNDKTNDNIDNLQILTQKDNMRKEATLHYKYVMVFKCPNCGKIFYRPYKNKNVYKKYASICCSRHCAGKFSWERLHNFTKETEQKINNNLINIIQIPYGGVV